MTILFPLPAIPQNDLVAHHWEMKVTAALDADFVSGILEQVPIGQPSEWCSRMVIDAKKNERPRTSSHSRFSEVEQAVSKATSQHPIAISHCL